MGAVCLAMYVVPAMAGARAGPIGQRLRASRPAREPFFHRYYLDVALLLVGALVFWELRSRGTLVSGGLFSDVAVNEALLFAPVLFLITVALAFMRLFPLAVRYIAGESVSLVHFAALGTVAALGPLLAALAVSGGQGDPWVLQFALALGLGAAYWWTVPAVDAGHDGKRLRLGAGLAAQGALVGLYLWTDPVGAGDALEVARGCAIALVPGQVLYMVLRAATRRAPAWFSLGIWHMARNPLQYSWLVLLMVLVTGLAVLSTTVGGTLDVSQRDRVHYQSAADIRVTGIPGDLAPGTAALKRRYSEISGVTGVSMMLREQGTLGSSGRGATFEMIGLEAQDLPFMMWYRDDFSDRDLPALMQSLRTASLVAPLDIPQEATAVGLYANPDGAYPNMFVWMIVEDANGLLTTITFGRIGPPGWNLMRAAIPDRARHPLRLVSIQIYEPAFGPTGTPGAVTFDDLHAVVGATGEGEEPWLGGREVVIEDFEGRMSWVALPAAALATTDLSVTSAYFYAGTRSVRFEFGKDTDRGIRGFYYSPTGGPVPVVASETLSIAAGAGIGTEMVVSVEGRLLPVRVVDTARYFPTADPSRGGFMLADLDALLQHLRMVSPTARVIPNEILITHAPGAGDAVVESLVSLVGRAAPVRLYSRDEGLAAIRLDPLISAGWRAVGIISVAVIAFVASLGYATYLLALAARSRGEMATLRSIGVSARQMLGLLALEHLTIVALGLGLGAWAGFQMTRMMVSAVSVTEDGSAVLPPFVLVTDWTVLGPLLAALSCVFVAALLALHRSVGRLDLQSVAREEAA